MAIYYGVLRGRVELFKRESDPKSPHLQIKVKNGQNAPWRIAVNVLSSDKSLVVAHRVDPLASHPVLAGLPSLPMEFTELGAGARSPSTSLDYFRAPLFDWPTGIAIPANGPGADDDLQDMLATYLTQLRAQQGEIFAFGAKFPEPNTPPNPRPIDHELGTNRGVHDVHMNQGNPAGQFQGDNGVFHDGGLILRFPTRYVGLFLRFRSQWLPTDNVTGNQLAGAQEIPPGGSGPGGEPGGGGEPTPVTSPVVYIVRALVNPGGDDVGKEVVVLGNTTTSSVNLTGWVLVDKNGQREPLGAIVIPAGESRAVPLSGDKVQLGNKGGTISLFMPSGAQAHAVSYSKADAAAEDRYIRFNT